MNTPVERVSHSGTHLYNVISINGMPAIKVSNRSATALISLQGAHVLSWTPNNENNVIWLSEDAYLSVGRPVRGGIPICWPWFGAHTSDRALPAHGFARTAMWEITSAEELEGQRTRITFTTKPRPHNESMWPADTSVEYLVTIGSTLEVELVTRNNGTNAITISQALHTYFAVGDIEMALLRGLEDISYLDKLDGYAKKHQRGPISFESEVDRIYMNTANECVLEDSSLHRDIIITKHGSHSTVVWNPWQETAQKMGDLGKNGYKKMLCVESSNAANDIVTIAPGQVHKLGAQYHVRPRV